MLRIRVTGGLAALPAVGTVTDTANHSLADAFVSIHVNAGGGRGAETFCYWRYGAGGRLAACIQNQLVMAMQPLDKGYLDRGIKERPSLCVLRETMMPHLHLWSWASLTARMCGS